MSDPADALYGRLTWRLVPFFCLCFLAAYLDRVNVGLAKLQMLGDLGWSETVYGLGSGLFFVGYILFEVPSNLALQKVGARLWIARIMVTWGLASAAMMLVRTPAAYYGLRFLLGVAEAGFMPGVLYYLSTWYPLARRGRITAIFMIGIPLSSVVGGPLSGFIMKDFQGVAGLPGWQWLFLIEALPAILLGLLAAVILPASIRTTSWLSDGEKALLTANLDADHHGGEKHALLAALRDARVWLLGAADGTILLGLYSITFWLPTIIRRTGVSDPLQVGLLTAIPHLAGVAAMLLVGWHADLSHERRWHAAAPMLLGAAGLMASTLVSDNLAATVALLAVANAGILGAIPPFWCIPGTFLRGPAAAAGLALAGSIANLAGFFSTYLVGWLLDLTHTPAAALIAFGLCLIAGSGIVLRLPAATVNR
jgi:MFS family permease